MAFCLAAAAAAAAVAAAAAAALLVATALALLAAARADTRLASLLGSLVPGEDPGGRGLDPGDKPGLGELLGSGAEMGGNNAGPGIIGAGSGADTGACITPLLGTTSVVLMGIGPAVDSAAQSCEVMSCAVREARASQHATCVRIVNVLFVSMHWCCSLGIAYQMGPAAAARAPHYLGSSACLVSCL